MNWVTQEMMELMHIGVSILDGAPGPGSGRYPRGSGEDPDQHEGDFATRVRRMRREGMDDKSIAEALGCIGKNKKPSVGILRTMYSNAINEQKASEIDKAKSMLKRGMTPAQISRELGWAEGTYRSRMKEQTQQRCMAAQNAADELQRLVDQKGMIDVGSGAEKSLNITKSRLDQALQLLIDRGYPVYGGRVNQVTNSGQSTIMKILCPPGTAHKEIYQTDNINSIKDYTIREDADGTEHLDRKFEYPASLDSKRLMIRYRDDVAPDGHTGIEKDGTIEIRRGCKDLDLGNSNYAQVRIMVDGSKYLKGMAFYSDDMPDGVDVIFNTNKGHDKEGKVLKDIKSDPKNPFGSLLREEGGQYHYTDENGERKLGLINKTRIEGDWEEWNRELPAQFLAKQPKELIERQLNLTKADKKSEFDEIMQIQNPTLRAHFLESFADDCDGASCSLKAAALPGQKYQVIMPCPTLKDNEVYAPNFADGTKIALVRFPHAGTFEIPILTVNNKNPQGRKMLGTSPSDAIGLNAENADRLSGADFDGDTVLCIPCNHSGSNVTIVNRPRLEGLDGFDPKVVYGATESKTITKINKNGEEVEETVYYRNGHKFSVMKDTQKQMGVVSNLITDMTVQGAKDDELARATRHSMVVIDAEKHHLDWKQSYKDNRIDELVRTYQRKIDPDTGEIKYGGASTLLSQAGSDTRLDKAIGQPKINRETGELEYYRPRQTYIDKNGKEQRRVDIVDKMLTVKDANELSTGTVKEQLYADYANYMKALANEARKEQVRCKLMEYSASAKEVYSKEVQNLMDQLDAAESNGPRERMAQFAANAEIKALKAANENMTKKEIKKASQIALGDARVKFGAKRNPIDVSPKQWEAIMAGAINSTTFKRILRFADDEVLREYALPRQKMTVTPAKEAKIRAMKASGYSNEQIAEAMHLSTSTIIKYASA